MAAEKLAYIGWEQRTYSGYLSVVDDGEVATLVGTPGMDPVVIQRAAGNETLPEVPADGMWTSAELESPAKPPPKQTPSTQVDTPASA